MYYNEWSLYMNKSLQNDILFSHKVQTVQAKMNLYLSLPVYSLTSNKI